MEALACPPADGRHRSPCLIAIALHMSTRRAPPPPHAEPPVSWPRVLGPTVATIAAALAIPGLARTHPPTYFSIYLALPTYPSPPPRSLFRDSSDNSSGTTRQGQLVRDNALSQRPVTGDDGGVEVRAPAPWAAWTAGHWRAGGGVTRTPQRGHGSREGSAPPVVAHRERGHVQSNKGGGEEGGGGSPPTCGCCSLLERRACVIGDTYGCAAPIA